MRLPIDAVPDITNVQVRSTPARRASPLEVEQLITFPVENAMNGIPRIGGPGRSRASASPR